MARDPSIIIDSQKVPLHRLPTTENIANPPINVNTPTSDTPKGSKWWNTVPKAKSATTPYDLKSIIHQGDGPPLRAEGLEFWPYVGALRPRRRKEVNWEDWENVFAVVLNQRLFVARCIDEYPFYEEILKLEFICARHARPLQAGASTVQEAEELYCVAWSWHPWECVPLLAIAGKGRVIYLVDPIKRKIIREFIGHGDEILGLAFCLTNPHMLASSSADKTTRIWNIWGAEPAVFQPPDVPNMNYGMGDAEEGTVLWAILTGAGRAGHADKVSGVAFHPYHRAIATAGNDRQVKIWALPPFPKCIQRPPPSPIGYRAHLIFHPIFSTGYIHSSYVDQIQWLGYDVLLSRGNGEIVTWQWLGYRRFFEMGEFAPKSLEAEASDYRDSRSFMICARYPVKSTLYFMRCAVHHHFIPTHEEAVQLEASPNLCDDLLFAFSPEGKTPQIHLWNPRLARGGDMSALKEDLKPRVVDDDDEDDDEDDGGDQSGQGIGATSTDAPTPISMISAQTTDTRGSSEQDAVNGNYNGDRVDFRVEGRSTPNTGTAKAAKNPSLEPWKLLAPKWEKDFRQVMKGRVIPAGMITCVGISPRGARWIVGAGNVHGIFIFRLKE